jgi:photosynthetic reaction center cytochrome c subunit
MISLRTLWAMVGLALLSMLTACERTQVVQRGYRGLAMVELYSPATLASQAEINEVPVALRKARATGPTAAEEYQNVQVLGDLSKPEFARLMLSFKKWIAPDEGCNFCHNAPDYASDAKYPKVMARAMIRMTRRINTDWKSHVKGTGVTCYTCHRGQAVPPRTWTAVPIPEQGTFMAVKASVRPPTAAAGRTALPADPLSDFLLHDNPIRVVGLTPLQTGNKHSISQARSTYSLMMVMSESLGVNCTYCHNTRAFYSWELSTPQRQTAWYGIRMVRDLNNGHIVPLTAVLPPERLGPTGDAPKVYCATCHLGSYKPLNGAVMIKDFPELVGPKTPASAPAGQTATLPPARKT